MASNLGGKRQGAGRPKGSRNKYNCEMEHLLKTRMRELGHDDYDPVVSMAEIGMDPSVSIDLRFKAHAEVAQYVRAKKRSNDLEVKEQQTAVTISPEKRGARIKELLARLEDHSQQPQSINDLSAVRYSP